MKTHHRKWFIFGGLLLAVVLGIVRLQTSTPDEPRYDGRKFSEWLDELAALDRSKMSIPQSKEAQAVRAIGTNALPWLLSEFHAHGSLPTWRLNQLLDKQTVIKCRFPDANSRLRRATFAFDTLGDLAKPAIPDLLNLVEVAPGYVPNALAAIGPSAVPALQQCLTNTRSFSTSAGQIAPIPGNTIGAIHTAISTGRLSKSDAAIFLPAIRDWAQSTNRSAVQFDYATPFLREFDR
jgi:hypothetical protein